MFFIIVVVIVVIVIAIPDYSSLISRHQDEAKNHTFILSDHTALLLNHTSLLIAIHTKDHSYDQQLNTLSEAMTTRMTEIAALTLTTSQLDAKQVINSY